MTALVSPARPAGSPIIGRFALLVMDELRLLIPQNQVHALEPGFDVKYPDGGGVGRIAVAETDSPVYCLSQDLEPLNEAPESRNVCVLLDTGSRLFGVLCDQVTLFEQPAPEILPVPACMSAPGMPLRGLMLQGEQVLCVGSAENLLACLGEQPQAADVSSPVQLSSEVVV